MSHMTAHFEFQRFELQYQTLEPEEGRHLCEVGRCRKCGRRYCRGVKLPADVTADEFLATLYRWLYQLKSVWHGPLPEGCDNFRQLFLSLFHEADQHLVQDWLSLPGNQRLMQMYRHGPKGTDTNEG